MLPRPSRPGPNPISTRRAGRNPARRPRPDFAASARSPQRRRRGPGSGGRSGRAWSVERLLRARRHARPRPRYKLRRRAGARPSRWAPGPLPAGPVGADRVRLGPTRMRPCRREPVAGVVLTRTVTGSAGSSVTAPSICPDRDSRPDEVMPSLVRHRSAADRDRADHRELGSGLCPAAADSDEVTPSRASGECRPDSEGIGPTRPSRQSSARGHVDLTGMEPVASHAFTDTHTRARTHTHTHTCCSSRRLI